MRRPSNPPAKSKAQLCALLSNSRKRSTKVAQRLEHRAALPPSQLAFWLSSVFFLANLILLLKSVVFLEIAIVIFAMLVTCLCTPVLAAPTSKPAKNGRAEARDKHGENYDGDFRSEEHTSELKS